MNLINLLNQEPGKPPSHKSCQFKRGQILQYKGDQLPKIFVVIKGLLRGYHIDENGKIHIFSFASSGKNIFDPRSVQSNIPSELFIDALEDSLVEVINLSQLDSSAISSHLKDIIIQALNTNLSELQGRLIRMMSSSTYERYEQFLDSNKDIACRIPQWMIASYLGITPEALSSVKGKYYRSLKSA